MTKVVIVHVKTVPNWDVSEDGREGRVRALPCRKTSETQAKVARISSQKVWGNKLGFNSVKNTVGKAGNH